MFQGQLSETAIRDTVASVFRNAAFNKSLKQTLGDKLFAWINMILESLQQAAREHPFLAFCVKMLVALMVVAIIGRSIYLAYRRAQLKAQLLGYRRSGQTGDEMQDAWLVAQRFASEGKYTEAAHAIYRHLLEWLAQRESVILHPSKTVGDYARDLRARSSRVFGNYRDFARSYEVVIYGLGSCDRERYDRLLSLATAITRKNG